MVKTTIQLDRELLDKLKTFKLTPRESYNEIIWRFVKEKINE